MELLPATTDRSMAVVSPSSAKIRIAKIGGRYLVFDVADVARLRRQNGICSVLVGITPQAPNQGVFSGLPLELAPDEVQWLVQDQQTAYVADDWADHLAGLTSPVVRQRYLETVESHRLIVQAAADAEVAERQKRSVEARARAACERNGDRAGKEKQSSATAEQAVGIRSNPLVRITPTASLGLVGCCEPDETKRLSMPRMPFEMPAAAAASSSYAMRAHLANRGYFATPGLRFGGDLSIYPGDPFRYHAHFVATTYGWDEPIALLDLVGTGRLATGVKKGLLIGGWKPPGSSVDGDDDNDNETACSGVRTFTLEWAAI
ncbi:tRNA-splicing endonuclease subunit sen34 [Grosmannia clavigera kw1407]|uniref:tRNA-splicing endonuclease subunit Sen34 n=1 Tax=Grosmannia clavigera (strain kw1407 / UAMH 11150) TaxID=655863 RepID=F0XFD2_GROCL|nr:tRNA-splicing endonuclease subunit sen34 [Grosmannia clavigera kw1407]EFX04106.1 tRNA-splicing endonuclease subunit sen34 [Grosmannia clavigera kw1407]